MRRGTFCCTFSPGTRQVYGRRPLEGYSFGHKGGGCPSRLIVHPLDGTGDAGVLGNYQKSDALLAHIQGGCRIPGNQYAR